MDNFGAPMKQFKDWKEN